MGARRRLAMAMLALLLLAAAAAQALGGWPHFRVVLLDAGVAADTVAAVGAGWLFGSALLLGLAALCVAAAMDRDGRVGTSVLCGTVAAVFAGFGLLAWGLRGNPHYANFIAIGLAALLLGWLARPRR